MVCHVLGRLPVVVPAGVTVEVKENNYVVVKGSKGTLERNLPVEMDIKVEDGQVSSNKTKRLKENEISSRFNKKLDPQHGCWCKRRLYKRA